MAEFAGFDSELFAFFEALSLNNERTWFQENKAWYESAVVAPMLAFIEAMRPHLAAISPEFPAIPKRTGGSMFRIYRDTRFAKDKTPYKTHAAAQFRHTHGKDVHAPGFYVHISPRESFLGAGIWHPAGETVKAIRSAIDEQPKKWIAARDHAPFRQHFEEAGDRLKRPPRGYDAEHPLIEDLKRKDFIAVHALTPPEIMDPNLPEKIGKLFAATGPMMQFLCKALQLPY